jgi:hypothetical protein
MKELRESGSARFPSLLNANAVLAPRGGIEPPTYCLEDPDEPEE